MSTFETILKSEKVLADAEAAKPQKSIGMFPPPAFFKPKNLEVAISECARLEKTYNVTGVIYDPQTGRVSFIIGGG